MSFLRAVLAAVAVLAFSAGVAQADSTVKYPNADGSWRIGYANIVWWDLGNSYNVRNDAWVDWAAGLGICAPYGCNARVLFMWSDGSHVGVVTTMWHAYFTDGIYRYTRAKCQNINAGENYMHCQKVRL